MKKYKVKPSLLILFFFLSHLSSASETKSLKQIILGYNKDLQGINLSKKNFALRTLGELAKESETNQDLMLEAGTLSILVKMISPYNSNELRLDALATLCHAIEENQKSVEKISTKRKIRILNKLLLKDDTLIQSYAARILCNLIQFGSSHKIIYEINILPNLLELLKSQNSSLKIVTISTLCALAQSSPEKMNEICRTKAIKLLVENLTIQKSSFENPIIEKEDSKLFKMYEEHIRQSIKIMKQEQNHLQIMAATTLNCMAYNNVRNQKAIQEAKGITLLIRIIRNIHINSKVKNVALGALYQIVKGNEKNINIINTRSKTKLFARLAKESSSTETNFALKLSQILEAA